MPTIGELEATIDNLTGDEPDARFRIVWRDLKAAFLTAKTRAEVERLRTILRRFRNKLPAEGLHAVKASAKTLDEKLASMALDDIFRNIQIRNRAINDLAAALQTEIDKGNADAELLKKIKDAVENASKAIDEIVEMIDDLTATPSGPVGTFQTLMKTIEDIIKIFNPDAA